MLKRIGLALRAVVLRRRLDREMREEMELHIARSTDRLTRRGMSPEEARRAARREFGNIDYLEEQGREARGGRWVEALLADVRFGLRFFGRTPVTTLTMVALLALSIGMNSALFTFLYSLGTMPSPGIQRDDALVRIRGIDQSRGPGRTIGRELSYPEYRAFAEESDLFSAVSAWTSADVVLGSGDGEQSLTSGAATYVTAGYFDVLGVRPQLGVELPTSSVDDASPELAAVIGHVVWDRHVGRAPDVVGRTLRVNDATVTVVGVAPRGFIGTRSGGSQMRVWLPLNARPLVQRSGASFLASYDSLAFGLAARLAPGVQAVQTNPTAQAIARAAAQQTTSGRPPTGASADVVPMTANNYFPPSGEARSGPGRATSLLIPLLILLIPCTNVSSLLVGLAAARRREIALRLSLGAVRARIVRQLITESVLLAFAAAVLGLLVIRVSMDVFAASLPDLQLVLHWPAILFTFAVAAAAGVMFGTSPALHATRVSVSDVLKDSAGAVASSRSWLHPGLVVAQIALTQPLLVGLTTLILGMLADLGRLPDPPLGDRIVQVTFNTDGRNRAVDDRQREETLRRLQRRLAALPGVVAVVPQEDRDGYVQVAVHPADRVEGVRHPETFGLRTSAAPGGFFSLMGYSFLQGREPTPGEGDEGTLVIRADMARRLWGAADPIGRRLVRADGAGEAATFVVVGVIDESVAGLTGEDDWHGFVPGPSRTQSLLVRTELPAEPMIPMVRSVANAEAPLLPITRATTLAATHADERSQIRRVIAAAGTGGFVALLLSAIGLYAIVAFSVGQRTAEIGIRTALGAKRQQVVGMFLYRGLRLTLLGLLIGLSASVLVVRLITLAEGREMSPAVWSIGALIAGFVLAVAALATWIPARRAAGVDPLAMLRAE